MTNWDPNLYLRFEKERTQPARDLVAKIENLAPARILDVGCGPGNSTLALGDRWPKAQLVGLDSSPQMIEKAQASYPDIQWVCADAGQDLSRLGRFDLVFSNAAIQWIPDHPALLANLFSLLDAGGQLAVQVPNTQDMPVQTQLRQLAATVTWQPHFAGLAGNASYHPPAYYYDILSGLSPAVQLWQTEYFHVLPSAEDILAWYKSTGLRPYLDCLPDTEVQEAFLQQYLEKLRASYPPQADGRVLFPFRRIFFTAQKSV